MKEYVKLSKIHSILTKLTKKIDPGRGSHAFTLNRNKESARFGFLTLIIFKNDKFYSIAFDNADDMTETEIINVMLGQVEKKE